MQPQRRSQDDSAVRHGPPAATGRGGARRARQSMVLPSTSKGFLDPFDRADGAADAAPAGGAALRSLRMFRRHAGGASAEAGADASVPPPPPGLDTPVSLGADASRGPTSGPAGVPSSAALYMASEFENPDDDLAAAILSGAVASEAAAVDWVLAHAPPGMLEEDADSAAAPSATTVAGSAGPDHAGAARSGLGAAEAARALRGAGLLAGGASAYAPVWSEGDALARRLFVRDEDEDEHADAAGGAAEVWHQQQQLAEAARVAARAAATAT